MIKNKDRSKWFGASDTAIIMSDFDTKTFRKWWLIKLGVVSNSFSNLYTFVGSEKEHQILRRVAENTGRDIKFDEQVKIRRYRLRVNFDGTTKDSIEEVKTTMLENVKKALNNEAYIQQINVEMFAKKLDTAELWVYGLVDEDYKNIFLEIDDERLFKKVVKRDNEFLARYLKRLKYLCYCLKKRLMPSKNGFMRWTK